MIIMEFYLCELSVKGCKNIDKTIKFKFCNSTLKKEFDFKKTNIKAIYGPNGAGKSAVMTAMYIYKRIITDEDGLNDKFFSNLINEVINKNTRMLEIEVTFLAYSKNNHYVLRHFLQVKADENFVNIEKEKISGLVGNSIGDEKFRDLVIVENGNIVYLNNTEELNNDLIYKCTLNLLNKHSVVIAYKEIVKFKIENFFPNFKNIFAIVLVALFAFKLVVELADGDNHLDYLSRKITLNNYSALDNIRRNDKFKEVLEQITSEMYIFNLSVKTMDKVKINKIESYENNIKQLSKFIKIFKPNFMGIEIDKKINQDVYYCKKIFVYKDYKIDIEFESTGIKKLVKLYTSLKAAANGSIVFIDEMDANLHDVYFTKLIQFFKEEAKGQLCFTTHNLEPIEVLKDCSHSLDFMSNDSRLSSWVRDGNKSPMKKYISGLIPYSPFNVESINFEVLLNEE